MHYASLVLPTSSQSLMHVAKLSYRDEVCHSELIRELHHQLIIIIVIIKTSRTGPSVENKVVYKLLSQPPSTCTTEN